MPNLSNCPINDRKIRNLYLTVVFDSSSENTDQLSLDQLADLISSGIQQRIDTFSSDFVVKIWVIDTIDAQDENDVDDSEVGYLFFNRGKLSIDFSELELNDYEPLAMRILRRVNLPATHLQVNFDELISIVELWKIKLSEILSSVIRVTYTDERIFFDNSHWVIDDFTKQLRRISCKDNQPLVSLNMNPGTPYPNVQIFDGTITQCDYSNWQKLFPKVPCFNMRT